MEMGRGTYMSAFKDGELAAAEEDVAAGCLGVWLCGLDGVISHVLGLIKHELNLTFQRLLCRRTARCSFLRSPPLLGVVS